MKVSVVAPVFNEIENLEPLVTKITNAFQNRFVDWEILLVNDGSNDGSGEEMERLAARDRHIRPLHLNHNHGQTAAMDAGIRYARFPFVLTIDADLQNDPADVVALMEKMEADVGCVCGVRTKRRDNFVKRMSSKIANYIRNRLSDENITDTGCSLKLFRKESLDRIVLFEGMHRFLPTLVKLTGFRVIEVPVSHHPRIHGESKYGVWNRVFRSFLDLLAVRWMKKRWLTYDLLRPPVLGAVRVVDLDHHSCQGHSEATALAMRS